MNKLREWISEAEDSDNLYREEFARFLDNVAPARWDDDRMRELLVELRRLQRETLPFVVELVVEDLNACEQYMPEDVMQRAVESGFRYLITFPRESKCPALFTRGPDVGDLLREFKTDPSQIRTYRLPDYTLEWFPAWADVEPVRRGQS